MPAEFTITASEDGKRLGEVLRARGCSHRLLARLKRTEGGITRGGSLIRTVDRVSEGDVVVLNEQDGRPAEPNPSLSVPVLFENGDVIVFDKPAGMPVHPSHKHRGDTLANCWAAGTGGTFRPLNRLDRDTSGCVAAAKTQLAAASLQYCISKVYYAVCCGYPGESGTIIAPIARERESLIRRCVREDGRYAETRFEAVSRNDKYTLCRVVLATGRTHQIRVHFAHIGCPLAGDDLYGGSCADIGRQALHCAELTLPTEGQRITVTSPLPADIAALV